MTKIICFEGAHGSGKGTLIEFLVKELKDKFEGKFAVIRDSEYPEFEVVKRDIRSGALSENDKIIRTVAETRAQIYLIHINPLLGTLDLAILDRSYYTSAVWQSESIGDMYNVIYENERRGIPKADMAFILLAPSDVIIDRLVSRERNDLSKDQLAGILRDQERYSHLAENCEECMVLDSEKDPNVLAREVYDLISANNAL